MLPVFLDRLRVFQLDAKDLCLGGSGACEDCDARQERGEDVAVENRHALSIRGLSVLCGRLEVSQGRFL